MSFSPNYQCDSGVTCCNGNCASNAGLQWAYYDNPDQQPNVGGSGYSSFDPVLLKDDDPPYQSTTTAISLLAAGQPIPIYGSPQALKSNYIALNHRGYIYAVEGGTYTFTSLHADEIVLYWLGPLAYDGWTRPNAVLEDAWSSPNSGDLITYTADLQQGQYYALRLVYANAQTNSAERISVTAPDGTVILGANSVENPYIVQYSCDGVSATPYPPFGQET